MGRWRASAAAGPDELEFSGSAAADEGRLDRRALDAAHLLEEVTLADVAAGELPEHVTALTADPRAWVKR